jgi:hypothetical protein
MLNQNKILIALFIIGCVVGYVLRLATAPNTKQLPGYTKKDSTYVQRVELPAVKKDSSFSIKTAKGKTTKRTDKITVHDSLGQSASVTLHTLVVDDSINVRYELEMLPLKFIVMKVTEITKTVLDFVEVPWYRNKWFYSTVGIVALLILLLTN